MKVDGRWKWFKLFTDKRASQKRWEEIVSGAEQRAAGVITRQMDAAAVPLKDQVENYPANLKRSVSDGHYRIAGYVLRRFVELAGWKALSDINHPTAEQRNRPKWCEETFTRSPSSRTCRCDRKSQSRARGRPCRSTRSS